MSSKFFEAKGKTKEEAIAAGLAELGVTLSDVDIEVIDEGKKGVLGILGSRPVVVRLTVKEEEMDVVGEIFSAPQTVSEKKAESKPASTEKPKAKTESKPKAKAEPKPSEKQEPKQKPKADAKSRPVSSSKEDAAPQLSNDELEKKAYDFLAELTRLMGVEVTINMARDEENNIRVSMFGDTLGILIGRRGETLDALQYLTSLYINRGQDEYTRITLDTENYRAKREEALVRLANRMANRAMKTGRKVVLEPMNPYERRILHSALQSNEAVTTHSEGEEPNRHVVITLK